MKVVLIAVAAAMTTVAGAVEFVECPKCDRRMRISEDGKSATVNVCRLKDDAPDPVTKLITHKYALDKMNEAMEMNISMKGLKIAFVAK